MVCRESKCDTDPLADIATLVKRGEDAPRLMNLMAVISVASGTDMEFVPDMLHRAVLGNRRFLDGWLQGVSEPPPTEEYSAGLHAATVCLDQQHQPWGGSDADEATRAAAVQRVEAGLTAAETYPFGPAAVVDQGLVAECEPWGETPPDEVSKDRMLPDVPTLILVGDHDLSTSWEWAKAEIRVTPHPQVLVVRGTGHSVQSHAGEFPQVLRRLESFLAS
jgi:pimeloyl-ACP methyl ester carboxylesterase